MAKFIKPNHFLIVLFSFFFFIAGCDANESKVAEKVESVTTTTQVAETQPTTTQSVETKKSGEKMSANPIIKLETSKGTMMLELDAEKAPNTVANFVTYVNDGFYDGLIFHRVIPNFMVQGGGMNPDMSEKQNKLPVKNEAKQWS